MENNQLGNHTLGNQIVTQQLTQAANSHQQQPTIQYLENNSQTVDNSFSNQHQEPVSLRMQPNPAAAAATTNHYHSQLKQTIFPLQLPEYAHEHTKVRIKTKIPGISNITLKNNKTTNFTKTGPTDVRVLQKPSRIRRS